MQEPKAKSGLTVLKVLLQYQESRRLPLLAYLEQSSRQESDLASLREIKAFRQLLEADPSLIRGPQTGSP